MYKYELQDDEYQIIDGANQLWAWCPDEESAQTICAVLNASNPVQATTLSDTEALARIGTALKTCDEILSKKREAAYTIDAQGAHDFWLRDGQDKPFPASFLNRMSVKTVAVLLNRENASRIESNEKPINIVLDSPKKSGYNNDVATKTRIKTDGYDKPKYKITL